MVGNFGILQYMSETRKSPKTPPTVEQRAEETFEALADCRDSFIVMGRGKLGATAVQLVCLPPHTPGEPRKRLELVRRENGRQFVHTVATDPTTGEQQSYPTIARAAYGERIRYHLVGTGRNIAAVSKELITPVVRIRLQQLQPFKQLTPFMMPEKTAPQHPQVTGYMSYNRARTITYGFAALQRTGSAQTGSEDIEFLTRVPYEGTFPSTIKPGIGLLVRNAVLDPEAPRPALDQLLRPVPLLGDCEQIAAAYLERLPAGSQIAVKLFDNLDAASYAVLGTES